MLRPVHPFLVERRDDGRGALEAVQRVEWEEVLERVRVAVCRFGRDDQLLIVCDQIGDVTHIEPLELEDDRVQCELERVERAM